MERIVQAIQVDDKNIADIFKLPCVKSIEKSNDGRDFFVKTFTFEEVEGDYIAQRYFVAGKTDWFCLFSDDIWRVVPDKEYQSLRLLF